MTDNRKYIIRECDGVLSKQQIEEVLEHLPFSALVYPSNIPFSHTVPGRAEPLVVEHGARLISLIPPKDMRLVDANFGGKYAFVFKLSRLMDEWTGGGSCSSFSFNTQDLDLPYRYDMVVEIYKDHKNKLRHGEQTNE